MVRGGNICLTHRRLLGGGISLQNRDLQDVNNSTKKINSAAFKMFENKLLWLILSTLIIMQEDDASKISGSIISKTVSSSCNGYE